MKSKGRPSYLFSRSICAEAQDFSGFGGNSNGQANNTPTIQSTIAMDACSTSPAVLVD